MPAALPFPASALTLSPSPLPPLPTGLPTLDAAIHGLPRGAIVEFSGARSSGKTALMISTLAQATSREETCAVVDTHGGFDPASAARSGVELRRVVWIRCNGDAGASLKVADLLLHGGGFGLVCLDLADVPQRVLNRLPLSYWHRFRLAVENKPTTLVVLTEHSNVKACAARTLECRQAGVLWSGEGRGRLLRGLRTEAVPRKPVRSSVSFTLAAIR